MEYKIKRCHTLSGMEFKYLTPYGYIISIHNPFGNCQNYVINWAEILCKIYNNEVIKEARKLFIHTYYYHRKLQIIMDISNTELSNIKKILKPFYIDFVETPYISTNKSSMVLCRIVLNKEVLNKILIKNKYKFDEFKIED